MSNTLQNLAPRTGTPSSPFSKPVFKHSEQSCEDQRPQQRDALMEIHLLQVTSPSGLLKTGITGTSQETVSSPNSTVYVLDLCPSTQSIIASTDDSAESIATQPESDFDDEQLLALLASPLYQQERGASTRKLVAVFSRQNWLNQYTFSDRDEFSFRHQQVFVSNEPFIRFSTPANVVKSLLDGNRDHLLAEARSELMKQEYKVESLNTCISELQQQTYAQRLKLEDTHHGYVESRREQVRLQEELSMMKKSASRHSDWKYPPNVRIEESSRITSRRILCTKIERKSSDNMKAHFTNTRVAKEGELHERFGRISRYRIEFQWKKFSRSQSTSSHSKSSLYAKPRKTLAT